jgi:hypothetical protein
MATITEERASAVRVLRLRSRKAMSGTRFGRTVRAGRYRAVLAAVKR